MHVKMHDLIFIVGVVLTILRGVVCVPTFRFALMHIT